MVCEHFLFYHIISVFAVVNDLYVYHICLKICELSSKL